MAKDVKRLFKQFQPNHYILDLKPDRQSMTFSGLAIISGSKTGRPSKRLTLHQKDLKITKARLTRHGKKGDEDITVIRINRHNKYDEVRLHTDMDLYPGNYTIRINFSGKISRAMNGIYPCFFKHDGKDKKLIATQFESHHAREVFPCVDEPEAKATFDLTLTTPANETVIANTPVKSQKIADGLATTSFETTPKMSSYLLAFVFGELGFIQRETKTGTVIRTYATPGNVALTEFALDTAVKCLEFYEGYFGIPYPLKKCDLVALPDFASGAMENWGCITFREQALLVDPDNSTLSTKQYVAMVIAHELAHQWFGNLVTMRWWTDLWLNEGFASWIEYLAVNHMFPDWQVWTQFIVDEQQQAMKLDALKHTHPIEVPVRHPDEIRSIFDAISYSKGASVIHMLHEYLGAEHFRNGLRVYLETHAYGNTDTVDLWDSLESVSGKPVKQFMQAWTGQPGFPVLLADISESRLRLKQQRFFINSKNDVTEEQTWPIPLQHGLDIDNQLNGNRLTIDVKETSDIKFNRGQSGFYRSAYNVSHLEKLGHHIHQGKLPPLDRLGILSDLFETAKAGQSDTADALRFIGNFEDENNYAVWDVIAAALGSLKTVMGTDELRQAIKPYTRRLISGELKRLGWDRRPNESHFDRLLRPIILGMAAGADEPTIVKRCRQLFDKIKHADEIKPQLKTAPGSHQIKRGLDIDPDMRGVVFGTIARTGSSQDFDKLLKLHDQSSLSEERVTLAAALTGFKQPELIKRALDLITTDTVRLQDVSYWLAYSFMNRHAKQATWQWLKRHWDWLQENLGTDLSFYRMPIYAARVFSDSDFQTEYRRFFEPKLSPAMERSYNQGLEMLEWQADWKNRDYKEVLNFFKNQA